ncbi:DUF4389 domain-containing protein [Saccharopolyspora sp. HNM0983]|uniref:DUF4389 domain-containing protein n=2 Tax=Saccharopolyspora montiporae TaxID=2781240 RepID=A0A929FZX7_9PSEU|nr:DUF4389 domain-containing protein [Saccharopolyspora sp. HNM0983]
MYRQEVDVHPPERQRRWTVLLRLLLLVPHQVVLFFLFIAGFVVVIIGWFAALALGRLPKWAADFLSLLVAYQIRVTASSMLLVDTYPPFVVDDENYPVRVDIRPSSMSRWTVLFRVVLIIPAALLSMFVSYGWATLGFFVWLTVLITGRTPRPVFDANAAVLRFNLRVNAYSNLLTGAYPRRLFGDAPVVSDPGPRAERTWPLVLGKGGRAMVIIYIVLGVLAYAGNATVQATYPPMPPEHSQYQYDYAELPVVPGQ